MQVRDLMTSPPITVRGTALVTTVAEMLERNGFTAVPVLDRDGTLIGIVTEGDLISGRIRPDPRVHGRLAPPLVEPATMVAEVMTTPARSVTPGADIADVAALMVDARIRCLPVVDDRAVVGVVTRRDLLVAAVRTDAAIRDEIRAILAGSPGLDPSYRWQVTVQGGVVDIADFRDRVADRARVRTLADRVRGVASVVVRHQTNDPS